jgi:hypothetical protein
MMTRVEGGKCSRSVGGGGGLVVTAFHDAVWTVFVIAAGLAVQLSRADRYPHATDLSRKACG